MSSDFIMTEQQQTKNINFLERQNAELAKENEFLLTQLLAVQDELERYYHKLADVEGGLDTDIKSSKGVTLKIENQRLRNIVSLYKSLRKAEINNSRHARFGCAIAKLNKLSLITPFKFFSLLVIFSKKSAPKKLGGKGYSRVIKAYEQGGTKKVQNLLDSYSFNSVIVANAYTALAKHLRHKDLEKCTYYAQEAYLTDPCDYRLKWWIMRLDEMNNCEKAKALLELLPLDTPKTICEDKY